jgi:hypothetical protein
MRNYPFTPDLTDPATGPVDDGYYETLAGGTQPAAGAPLSAYVLQAFQRVAHHAYVRLFDKTPGETRPRVYRTTHDGPPRGHRHAGEDPALGPNADASTPIASQLMSVTVKPQRDVRIVAGLGSPWRAPLHTCGPVVATPQNISTLALAGAVPATWTDLLNGPGQTGVVGHVLWALFDSAGATVAGVPIAWTFACPDTGDTLTTTAPSGPDGWAWSAVSPVDAAGQPLPLTTPAGALYSLDLSVAVALPEHAGLYTCVVWGVSLSEARS